MPTKTISCDCGSENLAEKCCDKPIGQEIGKITHYFANINVAVISLDKPLSKGDEIHIKGATTDFFQKVDSMQIEHDKIEKAKKGDQIGIKAQDRVRENDKVYKQ